ncbi:hypothetical protein LP414_27530 [Polaromonas sp. P1(28)-13]|nr:hypothetical protein LP414_27530 [Polaromonas sp. P1(28)-13]
MDVTITIQCDNAAFDPDPEAELARILKELSEKLLHNDIRTVGRLIDINGNPVGKVVVSG